MQSVHEAFIASFQLPAPCMNDRERTGDLRRMNRPNFIAMAVAWTPSLRSLPIPCAPVH